MHPGRHRIRRHVDRQVAEQLHAALVRVVAQCRPLLCELPLLDAQRMQLGAQAYSRLRERGGIPIAQARWPCPPGSAVVRTAQRVEQRVVLEPARLRARRNRANCARAASGSGASLRSISCGLPAWSERTQYGERSAPTGPSGSTCHTLKPAAASQSMKPRAAAPNAPCCAGSAVGMQQHAGAPLLQHGLRMRSLQGSLLGAAHHPAALGRAAPDRNGVGEQSRALRARSADKDW